MNLDCELAVINPGRPVSVFGSIIIVSMKRLSDDIEALEDCQYLENGRPHINVHASDGSLLESQCIHRHTQA
jgi:hypothetical protein